MTMKTDIVKKFTDEYKSQLHIYGDFAKTVGFILETLLGDNEFRYQIVSYRQKEIGSLQNKITDDKELQKLKKVAAIDDLAGCRVIFYIDSDIERFENHIYKEFDVIKRNLKYSEDEYNALHLIVKFNEDRLNLTEYAKFSGLKCEIQLTTILYHAWSEMAHDIIYKPKKELSDFDKQAFASLEKQFTDVMKNHIKEAQRTFDHISRETEKIKQGKQIFDTKFLNTIIHSESNNELYENLKLLYKYIEEFGDKTPKELDIISIMKSVLKKSKSLKIEPIKTMLGSLRGHSYSDVADACLDILNQLRYFHTEKVFGLLIILSLDREPEVKKKALEVLSSLSKYNLHTLKKISYHPQLLILGKIGKWSKKHLIEGVEPVVKIAEQLLSPSFEGHSMKDYETFVLQFGALRVDDNLKEIREKTIVILEKLYLLAKELKQKRKIIQVLQEATQLPQKGDYGKDMENMILGNTNTLINYYISVVPGADNEIIKDIEKQICWFVRRFSREKLPRIKELQFLIASNTEYEMFRTFVGYDFIEDLDWEKAEEERKKKIQGFIDGISEESYNNWERKILSVIKNYSLLEDRGEFQYFNIFLNELAQQKPKIAYKLLTEKEIELEPFLIHLVAGIWKSRSKKCAKDLISKWIDEGEHLPICACIFDYVEEIDKALLDKIFKEAKKVKDRDIQNNTFNNIIQSIVRNYPKHKNTKNLFIDTIKELTKNENWWWVNNVWYR
ncbi:RelA/SpoT domain-containing protein [Candidatus Oleimmundimicrobium sp.]|uniref:RelA/SpoT domain-containing protein n=1 Tax=Candidatus Oleimmundimicrobium sp. TaxID=3060597 RepID=UPI00271AAD80|nr:RelA/SpoT domain-containing protein [Candidatus Oleimmundimicrobium sp.]MDO8886074.1 RelA/SpoT domain-containing protein [Candidatus Oleimmundimicrobium sp.]